LISNDPIFSGSNKILRFELDILLLSPKSTSHSLGKTFLT